MDGYYAAGQVASTSSYALVDHENQMLMDELQLTAPLDS
jgi:hypothetical protein